METSITIPNNMRVDTLRGILVERHRLVWQLVLAFAKERAYPVPGYEGWTVHANEIRHDLSIDTVYRLDMLEPFKLRIEPRRIQARTDVLRVSIDVGPSIAMQTHLVTESFYCGLRHGRFKSQPAPLEVAIRDVGELETKRYELTQAGTIEKV